MINDSIQDSTRYVVKDIHHGSIMPATRAEMKRDVFLLPGADIRGGIWANDLNIEGPKINVEEAVYSTNSIKIKGSKDFKKGSKTKDLSLVTFRSSVSTADSIVVDKIDFKIRFMSDIYTHKINIKNSIVYGNIFSDSAIIDNSIVLGGVFCKDKLEISNSMVSTFRAKNVTLLENVYLFFPYAIADENIDLKEPIKAITFLNLYKDIKSKRKGMENFGGVIELDEDDIFSTKAGKVLGFDDEEKDVKLLSAAERILDISKVKKHFRYNKEFLEKIALRSHYKDEEMLESIEKPLLELEERLWNILKTKKVNTIKGTTQIEDLFERKELLEIFNENE